MYRLPGFSGQRWLSSCQQKSISIIVGKLGRLFCRLQKVDTSRPFVDLFRKVSGQEENLLASTLQADKIDLLTSSAGVDPLPFIAHEHAQAAPDPGVMFDSAPAGLNKFQGVRREHRKEYAKLVCKQLLAGTVELRASVHAGASIFPAGKKDSER